MVQLRNIILLFFCCISLQVFSQEIDDALLQQLLKGDSLDLDALFKDSTKINAKYSPASTSTESAPAVEVPVTPTTDPVVTPEPAATSSEAPVVTPTTETPTPTISSEDSLINAIMNSIEPAPTPAPTIEVPATPTTNPVVTSESTPTPAPTETPVVTPTVESPASTPTISSEDSLINALMKQSEPTITPPVTVAADSLVSDTTSEKSTLPVFATPADQPNDTIKKVKSNTNVNQVHVPSANIIVNDDDMPAIPNDSTAPPQVPFVPGNSTVSYVDTMKREKLFEVRRDIQLDTLDDAIYSEQRFQFNLEYDKYKLPVISVGRGMFALYNDVGGYSSSVSPFGKFNSVLQINVEKRIKDYLGGSVNMMFGKMTKVANNIDTMRNFQSKVFAMDIQGVYHFDNGMLLPKDSRIAPFVSAGLGFMTFNSYSDIKDKNGNPYYFWKDGSYRDKAFDVENPQLGKRIMPDYKFETKLDPTKSYSHLALLIPIIGGVSIKFWDQLEAKFTVAYYFTTTDNIDNFNPSGKKHGIITTKNDNFFFASVSFQYNLSGLYYPLNKHYKNVIFDDLDKRDLDGDGVRDWDDECPETPAGTKVDKKGCPEDNDNDGVADYMDKELSTPPNTVVTDSGETYTVEMEYQRYLRDSLIMAGLRFPHADSIGRSLGKIVRDVNRTNEERMEQMALQSYDTEAEIVAGQKLLNLNDPHTADSLVARGLKFGKGGTPFRFEKNSCEIKQGIVFKFQIASLNNGTKAEYFKQILNISEDIDITLQEGTYKYTLGKFPSYDDVAKACDQFIAHTGVDAFPVVYKDGTRIDMWQGKMISECKLPGKERNILPSNKLVYRVQIASLNNDTMVNSIKQKFNISDEIYVDSYKGAYKYSIGNFVTFKEAQKFNKLIRPMFGNINSFVIAFKNGAIVNLWESGTSLKGD